MAWTATMTIFINPLDREMKRALPMFERGRFFIFVDDHMSLAIVLITCSLEYESLDRNHDDGDGAHVKSELSDTSRTASGSLSAPEPCRVLRCKMLYGHFAEADSSRSTAVNLDDAIEPMFLALSITHGRFDIIPDASGPSFARIQCATDFPQAADALPESLLPLLPSLSPSSFIVPRHALVVLINVTNITCAEVDVQVESFPRLGAREVTLDKTYGYVSSEQGRGPTSGTGALCRVKRTRLLRATEPRRDDRIATLVVLTTAHLLRRLVSHVFSLVSEATWRQSRVVL
ncbi:nuclear pore protein-like protein [Colletotrichum kahawae]|uniref:Nuclear pore protein-like protein n=1 Tax=Colletotrichum kahawae TaxID=34407 RepID=A0AAD9Y9R8_COLKA|nr:nuclear pore protein-like protein [Colletotrichum kahawae]